MKDPLVSIIIANYNYGKYLPYCYESVLNQTYKNIEVISYDNHSQDDSFEIMQEYRKKFQEKGIWMDIGMQKRNLGSAGNIVRCYHRSEGAYVTYLSSDDAMKPTFVEKCVEVLSSKNSVGMVMVHRDEVDQNGNLAQTPPFYNRSCVVPGESQASVFMMAGIAVPSQVMMKRNIVDFIMRKPFSLQVAADWMDNFMAACHGDVAYIKDALCEYRVHTGNETSGSERNLIGIFEHYQLINGFMWIGESYGYKKHLLRYDEAVEKLGDMCLRYAHKMLNNGEMRTARRYLYLAPVFKENIIDGDQYKMFWDCCNSTDVEFNKKLKRINERYEAKRTVSYDPPADSIDL